VSIARGEALPTTRESIAAQLAVLGLRPGDVVLLHTSLSALGWVCGGATAVVAAFLDLLGADGTLVVPAQTPRNRDPATWTDPALPPQMWPHIREHLPAFDPLLTPSDGMGAVAERVRTWPGAHRSAHPQSSFAGVGARAVALLDDHDPACHLGERSPLARLERAEAKVVLLGVGYDRCTAFHLAEYRVPHPPTRAYTCVVRTSSGRCWTTYTDVDLDADDFAELGEDFEGRSGRRGPSSVTAGPVGQARARVFRLADAVSFATIWLIRVRGRWGGIRTVGDNGSVGTRSQVRGRRT
jgi:aminoglycoside 3-N-acetyltransferase